MGNQSLYLIAAAAVGQLPTPKKKDEETKDNPLDRFSNETKRAHPQYGNIFGKTGQATPDYDKGLTGSKPERPSYDGFFGKTPGAIPNYDKALGETKTGTPGYDGFFGKTPEATPSYDKALGETKTGKPGYDGFFAQTPGTKPNYDKALGATKDGKPDFDEFFKPSGPKTPNYGSVFGSGSGSKPDFGKVFQGGGEKPDFGKIIQTEGVKASRMTELYARQFGPTPAPTTKLGWEKIDALGYVTNKAQPSVYINPDPKVSGSLVIDHENGNIFYIPKAGTTDNPATAGVDESKPAIAIFGKDGLESWTNVEVPKRVQTAAQNGLIRSASGQYQSRDSKDKTVWYLQSNGTYWTPDRHDPATGKHQGAGTLDGDKFLTDVNSQKPLAGTLDIVELNLFQVADNRFKQIDVPGHFEIGSDGFVHYKGPGVPHGGKKGDDRRGPQYYDSSNAKISEHTWKAEK